MVFLNDSDYSSFCPLLTLLDDSMAIDDDLRFNFAVNKLLEQEGGYSNDPEDPGGETAYGITRKFLIDCGIKFFFYKNKTAYTYDMKTMHPDEAALIYRRCFWDQNNYNGIINLRLATAMLSLSVNLGAETANKLLQDAVNSLNGRTTSIDGYIGNKTLQLINKTDSEKLLVRLKDLALGHYEYLVERNPKLSKFLKGWKNRLNGL